MGDLQISLLVIGALAVAAVYLFNWWQERQFRRRSEQAFAREHEDVLLEESPARDAELVERVEPKIAAESAARPAAVRAAVKSPASAVPDPIIDYVMEVSLRSAIDGMDLHDELLALAAGWGKPVLVAGYDRGSDAWHAAGGGRQYSQLRFALQMSNRAGCVEQDQLTSFRDVVAKWAERKQGEAVI